MMNDRERQAIRVEFTSRLRWVIAITLLLSGMIAWLWFEDRDLYHYLWFAVVPLIFLIPLLRFHRAIRQLTEPGETTAAAAPGTSAVNEATKANIRRLATRIHWAVQIFLILLIAFGVFARWGFGKVADSFRDMQSVMASGVVIREYSRLFFGRGEQLIPFQPPSNSADRPAWADRIESGFGQSVAVFVREGGTLSWAKRNDSLAAGMVVVPRLFESDLTRDETGSVDTVGSFEVRRISNLDTAKGGFRVWIVGPLEHDLRWGVVLNFGDTWNVFFRELKAAATGPARHKSPAWTIEEVVNLGGKNSRYAPALRILRDGEVVYASPKVDTTRHVLRMEYPPMVWEYYSSEMDEGYARMLGRGPVRWHNFLGWLVLMAAFYQMYRWIRQLTAPTGGSTVIST